ncbi:MAG: hypothetical protein JZU65_23700, partial [Chlorobium sp.]|nr:hypothetical protein [Chlorobium sp.]
MSRANVYVCKSCKKVKYQLADKPRDYCHKCHKRNDNMSPRMTDANIAPHDWKQVDDEYVCKCMFYLAGVFNDIGESGPVVTLRP